MNENNQENRVDQIIKKSEADSKENKSKTNLESERPIMTSVILEKKDDFGFKQDKFLIEFQLNEYDGPSLEIFAPARFEAETDQDFLKRISEDEHFKNKIKEMMFKEVAEKNHGRPLNFVYSIKKRNTF